MFINSWTPFPCKPIFKGEFYPRVCNTSSLLQLVKGMKFTWHIMSLHLCYFYFFYLFIFFPSNVVAGKQLEPSCFLELGFTHSVFSTKIVNRRAYSSNTWILDTKATNHIVCSRHLLTTITIITETMVELPNGEAARVIHIETITLSSKLTHTNVLCAPSFSFNLLSISSITKSYPCYFVFFSFLYRTLYVGKRLEWDKYMMVFTCCNNQAYLKLLYLLMLIYPRIMLKPLLPYLAFLLILSVLVLCLNFGILD